MAGNHSCKSSVRSVSGLSGGFTFVELIVSLALLALLASVVMPVSDLMSRQNKEKELKQALLEVRHAIDAYKIASDRSEVPEQFRTASGYPPNLGVLTGIADGKKVIRFIRRIPRDPFANKNILKAEDTWGKRSYVSEIDKPKAGEDVYDIYSLSMQIGSTGVSYNQW